MVFHRGLSDSKFPQVSRTRLRILAVLSNAVVWIVSTSPPISKSSRPFNNPLVIVPNAPLTIGTIVTFMFHSFYYYYYYYYYYYFLIGIMVRVFANGLGDLGSIPGRVIPQTKKWSLMPPCLTLSITRNASRVKWSNPEKRKVPPPTYWCSSYRKGSLRVTLDYGRQLYFTY